ncbi:tail fiber domain-containing protein [Winogradskyella sp. R77965]|uniref:tail fiber domain-containing protein n=1 Tax=Winogradskyella sp. R77965 TaxID=3093872 RepID=UPI0037DD8058
MKKAVILITFIISLTTFAQQGINYKAVIKDDVGNIIANDLISVQFSILQGVAETNVYTETHTPTTDVNGIIVVNIGEGTVLSGDYRTIDWASDTHALNVQINIGAGLVDLGTTTFRAVPYALQAQNATTADNVSGLEALDEGNGIGWRLKGRDPGLYGRIGLEANDLSFSDVTSTSYGATGVNSTAIGFNTTAPSFAETVIGSRNLGYTPNSTTSWNNTDRLFVIGNGFTNTSNALTILKNGKTGIGTDLPNALLHLKNAASTNNPQLQITENIANAGTRINFKNAAETNNRWTLFTRTDNTHESSQFNIFYSGLSNNLMSIKGNGIININGSLALGNFTPGHILDTGGRMRIRRGNSTSAGIWFTDNDGVDKIYSGAASHSLSNTIDVWGVFIDDGYKFTVGSDGNAFLVGTLFQNSDSRLKTNITNLSYGLEEILQLQPKQYFWKKRPEQEQASLGLIAQEVEKLIPNIVHEGSDDKKTLSLSYIELIPVLINAIKEQDQKISDLEAQLLKVEHLEARLNALENRDSKDNKDSKK